MAFVRSIKNFTISFSGTEFGIVDIDQLVSDGTMISHGYVADAGSIQAGLNGGSTVFVNPNDTYQVVLTLPVDNDDMRTLQDIFNFGKNNKTASIGNFVLLDGNTGLTVQSESAFISTISDDVVTTDAGTGREVTFLMPNATSVRV